VSTFSTTVVDNHGEEAVREVTRIGAFNVISDGKYLEFVSETGRLVELQRQPQTRYTSRIPDLTGGTSGQFPIGLDPTRGQLLGLLVQSPSLMERVAQGKTVGYVIISLGFLGLLMAIWRLLGLSGVCWYCLPPVPRLANRPRTSVNRTKAIRLVAYLQSARKAPVVILKPWS